MPKGAVIKTEVKNEISLNAPETCLACKTPNVATFPVYLTELDGKITQTGHVGRCANCGHIKHYGVNNCIGRYSGKVLKADFHRWAVLKRNGIMPSEWIEAVCDASRNPKRMIWLDARNGLLPAEPEGKMREVMKRWEGLLNAQRNWQV
jgi:hypothetical protein